MNISCLVLLGTMRAAASKAKKKTKQMVEVESEDEILHDAQPLLPDEPDEDYTEEGESEDLDIELTDSEEEEEEEEEDEDEEEEDFELTPKEEEIAVKYSLLLEKKINGKKINQSAKFQQLVKELEIELALVSAGLPVKDRYLRAARKVVYLRRVAKEQGRLTPIKRKTTETPSAPIKRAKLASTPFPPTNSQTSTPSTASTVQVNEVSDFINELSALPPMNTDKKKDKEDITSVNSRGIPIVQPEGYVPKRGNKLT